MQRTHGRVLVEAVAELDLLQPRRQAIHHFIDPRRVHVHALGVHADLAGGVVDGRKETIEVRVVENRVLQNDGRIVAAQFQRDAREARRGHFHDLLAAAHRAGEADLGDVGVADQRGHVGIRASDDVEHAWRQLLGNALHDACRGQRRRQRRLHDDGVARQQRMRQRRAKDGNRPVEGHDDGDHAQRLVRTPWSATGMAPGTGGSTFAVSTSSAWLRASFQRISSTSESTQASKRILPFSCDRIAASASRFGAVDALQSGQHLLGALLRRESGPGRIRSLRGGNGVADILRRG